MKKFSIILAVDSKNGLGKNNDLAWKLKSEMKYFKETTTNTKDLARLNAVVMGRKTWDSIPEKFRPLPNRINCVLSRSLKTESTNSQIDDYVLYFNSIDSCLEELNQKENLENIFIIGGANLYKQSLNNELLDKIYITRIIGDFGCDVFFNGVPDNFSLESESEEKEEEGVKYKFQVYKKN